MIISCKQREFLRDLAAQKQSPLVRCGASNAVTLGCRLSAPQHIAMCCEPSQAYLLHRGHAGRASCRPISRSAASDRTRRGVERVSLNHCWHCPLPPGVHPQAVALRAQEIHRGPGRFTAVHVSVSVPPHTPQVRDSRRPADSTKSRFDNNLPYFFRARVWTLNQTLFLTPRTPCSCGARPEVQG